MQFLTRRFAKAPEGTAALFFIQIFATLGFAVLCSTLVLYATKHLHLGVKEATTLMGVFGAAVTWAAVSFRTATCSSGYGAAGGRLRLHRDRHARAVLRRLLRRVQRLRPFPGH